MPTLPTKTAPPTNGSATAAKLAQVTRLPHQPLWHGPCASGPSGGVTQSMLGRWLSCRERFRIKYVLGLEPVDGWSKASGFGNMWHVCEEALASKDHTCVNRSANIKWQADLIDYTKTQFDKYPMQREEIEKWYNVCRVQFPEYVLWWSGHPDVLYRTPLMQEQVFDVPYTLPSGRVVRLRGKFDSVDLIDGGIWLQENKTKSQIDRVRLERQLKFDLQTMMYLIALEEWQKLDDYGIPIRTPQAIESPIKGVRYNVVRRDLPIRKHKAKVTKPRLSTSKKTPGKVLDPGKSVPEETEYDFYERFLNDYVRAEPSEWFLRFQSEVSARDIQMFKDTCLDPMLEQLCWWYDSVTGTTTPPGYDRDRLIRSLNFRVPFGWYNTMTEQGFTEYDAYLETGSTAGLRQNDVLFSELI